MNTLIFGTRLALREWRAGKWTVLFFALILAVTAFTAQYFFSQKLQQALNRQAAISLGGDMAITSAKPLPSSWNDKAKKLGLRDAEVWSFSTVLLSGEKLQFASVQAVSNAFPLLGSHHSHAPPIGTVWLDKRLFSNLSLMTNSFVQIGVAKFKAVTDVNQNQDILSGLSFAPRVMMNLADVEKTQTIIPGSQVEYKLLLAGDSQQIKDYKKWLTPLLQSNQKLLDVHNQRILASNVLERADQYLALAIVMCLIMSGVALFIGIQHYLEQSQFSAALLRCLGLKQRELLKIFSWQLLWVAIMTSIIGISLGYGVYLLFLKLINVLLPLDLLTSSSLHVNLIFTFASFLPVLLGIIVSMALLAALVLPVFIRLSQVPVISLWRSDKKLTFQLSIAPLFLICVIFYGLFWLLIPDTKFVSILLNSLFMIIISLTILLNLFYKLLRLLLDHTSGIWRQGGLNLLRYQTQSRLQIIGFSIVIAAILLLYSVRTDLFSLWQSDLPVDTPNYFAINIAPDQVLSVQKSLKTMGVTTSDIYPMVRGRLIELNHQAIFDAVPPSARDLNALHRELNLSWMLKLPSDNKVIKGPWWSASSKGQPLISIEKNLADNLGIKQGDKLTFQIGDQQLTGEVKNFRTLNWASFHPNFYIIFPPGVLDKFPTTYITSFYLSPDKVNQLNSFTQHFPNMTLIDASMLLQQAKMIIDRASKAMQYAFLLTLIAGILLLIASLQTTLYTREQAFRIMRILGASRYYVSGSLFVEFCLTGLLAGFVGALCSTLISWGVAYYWLHITYVFQPSLWLWGSVLGLSCLTFPALIFTRRILKTPPFLRE